MAFRTLVEKEAARASLQKQRFAGLRFFFLESVSASMGLFRHTRGRHGYRQRHLQHLELLWLPYYLVTWHVDSKKRSRKIPTLVGGHERNFSLSDPQASFQSLEEGEFFEPAITEEDALDTSRSGLWRAALNHHQSQQLRVDERPEVEVVQYPFWAYYFRRPGGKIDFKLLDAVTGSIAGPKDKVALLRALAQRQGP